MLDNKRYRAFRAKGFRASQAYRIATHEPPELGFDPSGERATFERDGFDLLVTVQPDDYTDLSWLGEFTDTREDGAIRNPDYGYTPHVYEWFVPTYTAEQRRADLHAAGYSRGVADFLAREQVRQDAAMAVDYSEAVITVKARRAGVTLGTASVGGVGLGDDYAEARRYIAETAEELTDEAITEARETLATLCPEESA